MAMKTKRTYNLNADTVTRVKELVGRPYTATTQDGVVELAIERLSREIRDREEGEAWAAAASDPEFSTEMQSISTEMDDPEPWPR